MTELPTLFLSHGAPTLLIDDCPARDFLLALGTSLARPRLIIVVSAHHQPPFVAVSADKQHQTLHDFSGFPPPLSQFRYDAPGAPHAAHQVIAMLRDAGFDARSQRNRGLDHGAWIPLSLLYPAADIPIVQVSLQRGRGARFHRRLGEALRRGAPRNSLILGSGSVTHNLAAFFDRPAALAAPAPDWVSGFSNWLNTALVKQRYADVESALQLAPDADRNHPTDEHFLPLLVALGNDDAVRARTLHRSTTHGVLSMDCYAFEYCPSSS